MATGNESKETDTRNNSILFRYSIVVVLLLGLVVSGIVYNAIRTAFVEKDKWIALAETQKRPDRLILPCRGNIYSADDKLMATSVPLYYMYMDFRAEGFDAETFLSSKEKGIDSLSVYLSRKLKDRTPAGYRAHLKRGLDSKSRRYRIYDKQVSYSDLKEIRTFPFLNQSRYKSGFYTLEQVKRQRPFGMLALRTVGDVYGYIDSTGLTKGRSGLELQYDTLLHGVPGVTSVQRVGGGWTNVVEIDPIDGMDIRTTIDIEIQDITEKSLVDMLKRLDAESGTAVVMEVKTGEVKAITNMGRIRKGVYYETQNHAVADMVEPGSTFKVASMMVALEDGVCRPDDMVDTGNGLFRYGGREMTDHNRDKGGYGRITAEEAIWFSSNIGVAKLILKGYENNPAKFVEGLYRIGLNANLHLEIPEAGHSYIRMPDDKLHYWSKTTLPWMSFGYETQIPPIYMLTFYNAIANNGKMVRPMFTKEILQNGKTVKSFSTEVINSSICSDKTLRMIRTMLVDVVEKGLGKPAFSDVIRIAGKTGTAQIAGGGGYRVNGHLVSFAGYFPAEKPVYSCIVVIRRPNVGYASGGAMSGAVVKSIAEKIYARRMAFDICDLPVETAAAITPDPKNGDKEALINVLDALDIQVDDDRSKAAWIVADARQNKVVLKDLPVQEQLTPSVVGMGAKDAVYLLEKAGLRVSISGMGRVTSQSVAPGRRVSKGETVHIVLK
ncbi:MAG: transpeptidase family protein [Tannerellaceae bacterium]|jgi:cell division protein FtsI (penicillin-binding protein 3)|nr:transpeptidase family protein [Tannerellaceae bacterium]